VACLTKDAEALLAFHDFPAEKGVAQTDANQWRTA